MVSSHVTVPLLGVLALGASVRAQERQSEAFRKRMPGGTTVVVREENVRIDVPPPKRELLPGEIAPSGKLPYRQYSLVVQDRKGPEGPVMWRKLIPVQELRPGVPSPHDKLRVFDVLVGQDAGYVLCAYFDRVCLEAFGRAGEAPQQNAIVEVFVESELAGRTAARGRIEVREKEVRVAIDTWNGKRELWRIADGKAVHISTTGIPSEEGGLEGLIQNALKNAGLDQDQDQMAARRFLMQLLGERYIGRKLRQRALSLVEKGRSNQWVDDIAAVLLTGIDKTDGADVLMECYEACAPHLRRSMLEEETKRKWKKYPELRRTFDELLGGDPVAVLVRYMILEELREQAEILKGKPGNDAEVRKIEKFVARGARKLLEDWTNSEFQQMIEELAGKRPAK